MCAPVKLRQRKLQNRASAELEQEDAEANTRHLWHPQVPMLTKRTTRDPRDNLYRRQTYEAFPVQVQWTNRTVDIDQRSMNLAFRYAAKEVEGLERRQFYRMMNRVSRPRLRFGRLRLIVVIVVPRKRI